MGDAAYRGCSDKPQDFLSFRNHRKVGSHCIVFSTLCIDRKLERLAAYLLASRVDGAS